MNTPINIERSLPFLGFGLGLRTKHYYDVINNHPKVDWFEILTENYLIPGGKPYYFLDKISEQYPIVMHGVSLSIGSQDPIQWDYLKQVKQLAKHVNAKWISDHLCWTGIDHKNMHDLLPLPYTAETIKYVASRIRQVQDFLEQKILIENVSSYLTFTDSEMTEWDFVRAIAEESDCLLLLDINNIYVSSFNHQFDPIAYLNGIPAERVQQFHLAGHTNVGNYIIDTHDHDIIDPVWALYAEALNRFGKVSTMIERDDHIPPLEELIQELEHAKHIANDVFKV
jgi:uncharacterized protein